MGEETSVGGNEVQAHSWTAGKMKISGNALRVQPLPNRQACPISSLQLGLAAAQPGAKGIPFPQVSPSLNGATQSFASKITSAILWPGPEPISTRMGVRILDPPPQATPPTPLLPGPPIPLLLSPALLKLPHWPSSANLTFVLLGPAIGMGRRAHIHAPAHLPLCLRKYRLHSEALKQCLCTALVALHNNYIDVICIAKGFMPLAYIVHAVVEG